MDLLSIISINHLKLEVARERIDFMELKFLLQLKLMVF